MCLFIWNFKEKIRTHAHIAPVHSHSYSCISATRLTFLRTLFITLTLKLKPSQPGDRPWPGVLSLVWCLAWCGNCDTFFALKHRWELAATYIKPCLTYHSDKTLTARLPFGTLDQTTKTKTFFCWIIANFLVVYSVLPLSWKSSVFWC